MIVQISNICKDWIVEVTIDMVFVENEYAQQLPYSWSQIHMLYCMEAYLVVS